MQLERRSTTCPRCNGDRWFRRLIPHPYLPPPAPMILVTQVCSFCDGRGSIPLQLRLPELETADQKLLAELTRERDPLLTPKERK